MCQLPVGHQKEEEDEGEEEEVALPEEVEVLFVALRSHFSFLSHYTLSLE